MCLSISEVLFYLLLYVGPPVAFVICVVIYLYVKIVRSTERGYYDALRVTDTNGGE